MPSSPVVDSADARAFAGLVTAFEVSGAVVHLDRLLVAEIATCCRRLHRAAALEDAAIAASDTKGLGDALRARTQSGVELARLTRILDQLRRLGADRRHGDPPAELCSTPVADDAAPASPAVAAAPPGGSGSPELSSSQSPAPDRGAAGATPVGSSPILSPAPVGSVRPFYAATARLAHDEVDQAATVPAAQRVADPAIAELEGRIRSLLDRERPRTRADIDLSDAILALRFPDQWPAYRGPIDLDGLERVMARIRLGQEQIHWLASSEFAAAASAAA